MAVSENGSHESGSAITRTGNRPLAVAWFEQTIDETIPRRCAWSSVLGWQFACSPLVEVMGSGGNYVALTLGALAIEPAAS